jgi:dTDP-4-dehydrorhamnose 3,5-epimerase
MLFSETKIGGVFRIELERREDERGYFARTWSRDDFVHEGLVAEYVQSSVSYNTKARTLRGMHYQAAPRAETKIITCLRGAIYDVAVDLRPHSSTFRQWTATTLSSDALQMLYVPEGCAHGFLTLTPEAVVHYQISEIHSPGCSRGVRWNDPAFAIEWPANPDVISERDAKYPDFQPPEP